jgi:hypothetical protein
MRCLGKDYIISCGRSIEEYISDDLGRLSDLDDVNIEIS